ncbi:MAG: proline--tRNA ligase [Candidatus Gottesmanbacteria bacterium]
MAFDKKEVKKKSDNISNWYNDIVLKAELADYGPVKGTMVIRPYGYAIWETVQRIFDGMIKPAGVENAYFPMFIPMSLLEKEKEHVEGFSPELAVVTHAGGEKLAEPLVVRPTSETIMYSMFAKWVKSWRDLPLLLNQWCNIVRWEKRTYLFLRTTEFLWQEGHTAHATHEEAVSFALKAHEWYRQIFEDYFALPVMLGSKSKTEQFAGAARTYTVEILMPDGKALQSATSHDLGQNFSKVFGIQFQDKEKKLEYAWQTSWGMSTRALGGLFLTHGDDAGLILPPKVAPIQVVIVPILSTKQTSKKDQSAFVDRVYQALLSEQIRVHLDDSDDSPGRKFNKWEMKGVPIRIEIGVKETDEETVTLVFRDIGEKKTMAWKECIMQIDDELAAMQTRLFEKQKAFLKSHTFDVSSYDEFKNIMASTKGFLKAFWCEDAGCEKEIKNETKATTRCLPLDAKEDKSLPAEEGVCIHCGKPATHRWIFGQSY